MDVTATRDDNGDKITITIGFDDATVIRRDIAAVYDSAPETTALFMALIDVSRDGKRESVRNPGEFVREF